MCVFTAQLGNGLLIELCQKHGITILV